jgi:RES domain
VLPSILWSKRHAEPRQDLSTRRPAPSRLEWPPDDLGRFPAYSLRRGTEIHRNHRWDKDPWWFASSGEGRFDLVGRQGFGTCCLAQRPVGGLLEAFKGLRVVSEDAVDKRREFSTTVSRGLRLANCCVKAASRFGVNAEIHSTTDYDKTHAWAAALHKAGFDGIRYFLRSDPALKLIGYALFDEAGEAPPGRWPSGRSDRVAPATLREAREYGFEVIPVP